MDFISFHFALQNRSLSSEQRNSRSFRTRSQFGTAEVLASAYIIDYRLQYIGQRFQSVIDGLISTNQNVYIKGR